MPRCRNLICTYQVAWKEAEHICTYQVAWKEAEHIRVLANNTGHAAKAKPKHTRRRSSCKRSERLQLLPESPSARFNL